MDEKFDQNVGIFHSAESLEVDEGRGATRGLDLFLHPAQEGALANSTSAVDELVSTSSSLLHDSSARRNKAIHCQIACTGCLGEFGQQGDDRFV
ncbi:MAG TPA: hypothetical protein VFF07_00790 [Actinomycetota bacterium]|nr:hypothetical protein [Actinomycetota bacterium]